MKVEGYRSIRVESFKGDKLVKIRRVDGDFFEITDRPDQLLELRPQVAKNPKGRRWAVPGA